MSRRLLANLLDRNDDHVASLSSDALSAHRDGQRPPVVSVCCSDSRVSQEGMWEADPGYLFTVGNIGNRVTAAVDGEQMLSGSVAYPLCHTDTGVVAVVAAVGLYAIGPSSVPLVSVVALFAAVVALLAALAVDHVPAGDSVDLEP